MIQINTYFVPIRAVIGDNKPVTLEVVVFSKTDFNGYLEIITPLLLGFDRLCIQHFVRKKIFLKENEQVVLKYNIYIKDRIKEGIYPIKVKLYSSTIKKETVANLRVIKRK